MYYVNLGLTGMLNPDGTERTDYGIFGNGTDGGQSNIGLIVNLQNQVYWSGLESALMSSHAYCFAVNLGFQCHDWKTVTSGFYAWAVRPGDVASALPGNVPEPATLTLMVLGLAGLGAMRRRAI